MAQFTDEKIRLLKKQEQIKSGEIEEENLDKEDVMKLKDLYIQQIFEINRTIENYQAKLKV